MSVGSLLALFGLFDYRSRPEFCVCVPWGSLSLFCFLLPHPRGCRTTDNTRTKHSRYSTVCQSTKPFDYVPTLTDAVAPTRPLRFRTERCTVRLYQCVKYGPQGRKRVARTDPRTKKGYVSIDSPHLHETREECRLQPSGRP